MERSRAIWLLVITSILWSISGLFIKSVEWNPMSICGVRGLIAAVTLYLLARPIQWSFSREQIVAALAYTATVITFVLATRLTTSANAIFLQYTAPIYVALLGGKWLGEKTSSFDWLTILIALLGMFLFFFDQLSRQYFIGNLVAIVSGVAYAWSTLEIRNLKKGSPQATIILGNLFAFVISIPFVVTSTFPPVRSWVYLFILGIFQLGLATFFYSKAVKSVRALELIMIPFLEPILNPIWVFLFLNERPGEHALLGGGIILGSVGLRALWPFLKSGRRVTTL